MTCFNAKLASSMLQNVLEYHRASYVTSYMGTGSPYKQKLLILAIGWLIDEGKHFAPKALFIRSRISQVIRKVRSPSPSFEAPWTHRSPVSCPRVDELPPSVQPQHLCCHIVNAHHELC